MLHADTVFLGGRLITLDAATPNASALAIRGERIEFVGDDAGARALVGPRTLVHDLRGKTLMPGLIDAHAHLDREGLKFRLPSLAGLDSIAALVDRLAQLAAQRAPSDWLVTMPLGDPPFYLWSADSYAEKRVPNRHDLDRASGTQPIFIRPPWGFWPSRGPTPAIANSAALARAGIDRTTQSPSPKLEIERDSRGEPTGVLWEHERMPLAELTLFRAIPSFTLADRYDALLDSMRRYNACGTTSVVEAHGVAPQTMQAWQMARDRGTQSVRGHLLFSPGWGAASADDVTGLIRSWLGWLRGRGLGDSWLAASGLYTEIDAGEERLLRASCAPQTGWAGFLYDSAIPEDAVRALLIECARNGIRVAGVYRSLLPLYREAARIAPIGDARWILGHQFIIDAEAIAAIRDLGLALTMHTNAHIWKRGQEMLRTAGADHIDDIVPVRRLLDAGIRVSLGTDNVPISMWGPVSHVVARRDRYGAIIAPDQAVSVEEALTCATANGAWTAFEEDTKGRLAVGMLADLLVLDEDPRAVAPQALAEIVPRTTVVGGRIVYQRQ